MKNLLAFIVRYYHWLMLLLLEVASGFLLFQYNSYQGSVWFSSANAVAGKLYQIESSVLSYFSLTRVNEELTLRNFYLERQVDQLRRLYGDLTQDTTILERQELEFLNRFQLIPAKVVSNMVDKTDNLLTIDKGRADGVERDMGVACGNGIVGVVYLVSEHYSVVIPVLNKTSSRISCKIRGRGYFGYLQWYGGDPAVAYVEDVPRHARFKRGDWVGTSGYSAIFPPDIPLGVAGTSRIVNGAVNEIEVHLFENFTALRFVTVVENAGRDEIINLENLESPDQP